MSNSVLSRNPYAVKSRWFAVRYLPQMERLSTVDHVTWRPRVVGRLRRLGFGVYLPMQRSERQHRRSKKWTTIDRPLMPGYLFVEVPCGHAPNWMALDECQDVIEVLGDGEAPMPILPRLVERLMAMQLQMAFDDTRAARIKRREIGRTDAETAAMLFPVGSRVLVTDGPMARQKGRVTGIANQGVVELAISAFGRLTPVAVPMQQLELAA